MNFNEIFNNDSEREFFFNQEGYPKNILMCGFIDLELAKARLEKGEYYTLVICKDGQELPECYKEIENLDDGTLLASVKPSQNISAISQSGGIQMACKLNSSEYDARYLLGPGPETIQLSDLIDESINNYKEISRGKTL